MEFIHHTINWTKGEIFEGIIIAIFGAIVVIFSFIFWKFGLTPGAKALFIPLLVVGLVFVGSGIAMNYTNKKRIVEFKETYKNDPENFVKQEKKRVKDFQYLYTLTKILATVFFALAMVFFWFTKNHYLQAIGIALILFGLSGLVIDYFSQERADTYYEIILKELG